MDVRTVAGIIMIAMGVGALVYYFVDKRKRKDEDKINRLR